MLGRTRTIAVACALFGVCSAAFAIGASPADKANVQAVIDKTPGAANVWTLRDDGNLLHKAGGHVCPAGLSNVELWTLPIYGPSDFGGSHVSCEYGRGAGELAEAKLSISFVRLVEGETLDSMFGQYQNEIFASLWHIKPLGPAMKNALAGDRIGAPGPAFRSQAYEGEIARRPYGVPMRSSVWVASTNGWVVQARATYRLDQKGSAETLAVIFWAGAVEDIQSRGTK